MGSLNVCTVHTFTKSYLITFDPKELRRMEIGASQMNKCIDQHVSGDGSQLFSLHWRNWQHLSTEHRHALVVWCSSLQQMACLLCLHRRVQVTETHVYLVVRVGNNRQLVAVSASRRALRALFSVRIDQVLKCHLLATASGIASQGVVCQALSHGSLQCSLVITVLMVGTYKLCAGPLCLHCHHL